MGSKLWSLNRSFLCIGSVGPPATNVVIHDKRWVYLMFAATANSCTEVRPFGVITSLTQSSASVWFINAVFIIIRVTHAVNTFLRSLVPRGSPFASLLSQSRYTAKGFAESLYDIMLPPFRITTR